VNPETQSAPIVLVPKMATAIWGGDALVKHYGKSGDPSALLGESWECWDEDTIAGGAFNGETLADVRIQLGRALTGPADPAQRFPVLTKIIDAHAALSVQVHPDDAYAQRVEHQPVGKTECWYILAAEPNAELVLGWTHDTDRTEYERRVADGTLGEILRKVPVTAGDAFYLPAGTLHAIGAGIQLFETQQASDLTYRIFDWNRTGPDGKPRELHVAKAADVLDFRATNPHAVTQLHVLSGGIERTIFIADPRFAVERVRVTAAGTRDARPADNAHRDERADRDRRRRATGVGDGRDSGGRERRALRGAGRSAGRSRRAGSRTAARLGGRDRRLRRGARPLFRSVQRRCFSARVSPRRVGQRSGSACGSSRTTATMNAAASTQKQT